MREDPIRRSARLVLCLVAAISVACASPMTPSTLPPVERAEAVAGDWLFLGGVVDGSEIPAVPEHRATMTFGEEGVGGRSVCGNSYGGDARIEDGAISIAEIFSTGRGCPDDRTQEADDGFTRALAAVREIRSDGSTLELSGDGAILRFQRIEVLDTAPLVDRVWVLQRIADRGAVMEPKGDPSLLELELKSDGTFRAGNGCAYLTGRWEVRNDEVSMPEAGFDEDDACPEEPTRQQIAVLAGLSDGFRFEVAGERLRVVGRGGTELIYQAAPR